MSGDANSGAAAGENSAFRRFLTTFLHRPVAIATLAFLGALILACLAAPLVAPYDPRAQDLTRLLTGPSAHNLLGTDTYGRDVLSRILYGGLRSMRSVLEGVFVVLVVGVPLGLIAGYIGGWTDSVLSRTGEVVLSIPAIIFVLVVVAVFPGNEDAAMVAFGFLGAPTVFRVVRGATLKVRDELYITAARVTGLSHMRIVFRHVLPRVTGPVIVQATIFAAYALTFEIALSFLGLTGNPSTPTWGGMIGEASTLIEQQAWLLVPPGVVIVLTILALGLLGDAVRDSVVVGAEEPLPTRRRTRSRSRSNDDAKDVVRSAGSDESRDTLLEVRDLSVVLRDGAAETPVLDGVSFDVSAGETLGIVGESGCGKTVTAMALLRLLPPGLDVDAGTVRWEGRDILALSDREFDRIRGSSLAFVSQEPQASLDPTFTVGSQLVEVIRRHERISRKAARARALELLRLVELPEPERVSGARAHELSGGMAQRIAMAIALAGRPQLLIADEPTTALDVTVQAEILSLLRRLQEETGLAIIVITHNWGVVADICDRTLVMYAGQVVEQAKVQELFDEPLNPYTLGLLESHPSLVEPGLALNIMPGSVPSPGWWPEGCRFAPRCRFATEECRRAPVPLWDTNEERKSRCLHIDAVRSEVKA